MSAPNSPLDLFCRGCAAEPGRKCGTVPNRNLLRRRIRAGEAVTTFWSRQLPYFHDMRWRDFKKAHAEYAKLADWNARYGRAS